MCSSPLPLHCPGMYNAKTKTFEWTPAEGNFAVDCQSWVATALGSSLIDEWHGHGTTLKLWETTKRLAGYAKQSNGMVKGVGYTLNAADQACSGEWSYGVANWLQVLFCMALHCIVWQGYWCGVVWCGVVWCGVVWCGVVCCGVVWCGVVWCGVVWCGVVRYKTVRYGMVWYGMVWYGMVWYGMVTELGLPCRGFTTLLRLQGVQHMQQQ